MKRIDTLQPIEQINEAKLMDLIKKSYDDINIIFAAYDEGYIDKNGAIKKGLTDEDISKFLEENRFNLSVPEFIKSIAKIKKLLGASPV